MSASTFRILDLPVNFTKQQLLFFAETRLCTDENVISCSLSPSPSDQNSYQIATITFDRVPVNLKACVRSRHQEQFEVMANDVRSKISFDTHFLGLTPLNDTGRVEKYSVDLIFVTGLAGHAFGSWKAHGKSTMWVRDFLAKELDHQLAGGTRVLTYGYDSTLLANDSNAGVSEFSRSFLETLKNARRLPEEHHRPIVFVAHSLGGIVVKHALVEAATGSAHDKNIVQATYACVLLGVPNRGLHIEQLTAMVKGQRNEKLVLDLGIGSQLLRTLHNSFCTFMKSTDSRIICVYETKPSPTVEQSPSGRWQKTGPAIEMVTKESAILSIPIGGRYEHLSRDVDHSDLAKFSSRADQDYINLRGKIIECVEEAPNVIKARIATGPGVATRPLWDTAFTLPFHMKDFKNPNFTGRGEILDRLDTEAKSPSSKVIVLHGLGGMGKTQIALEYVHSYYEGYSAVFWVDGTSEETANVGFRSVAQRLIDHHVSISTTPQPDYDRIAQVLGLSSAVSKDGQLISPGAGSTNQVLKAVKGWFRGLSSAVSEDGQLSSAGEGLPNQVLEAVKGWFSQKDNKHWLLVLDNVDDLTSFNIGDFIPIASHGTVLITSRRRECMSLGKGLEIEEMSGTEAVLLLLKSAELDMTDSDAEQNQRMAKEIAKTLGYLPLAISQAGSYVAARQMGLSQYMTIYKTNFTNIFGKVPGGPAWHDRDRKVFTTWEISFREIEAKSKKSAELLLLCSFLHNEDIWEEMLRRGLGLEKNDTTLTDILEPLFSYSLAHRKGRSDSFYIHPLVHHWARERLSPEERLRNARDATVLLSNAVCVGQRASDQWKYEMRITAHLEVGRSNTEKYFEQEKGSSSELHWLRAMDAFATSYLYQERLTEAEKLLLVLLEAMKRFPENEHLDTGIIMANLATTYRTQGRWAEAEKLELAVLEAMKKSRGNDHLDTVMAMANLAFTYWSQGRWAEAEKLELVALETRKRLLGNDHLDTVLAMTNLAGTYSKQGRWAEAEKLELAVLEARKRLQGNDHLDTVRAIANLAETYSKQERWTEAEKLQLEALEARKRLQGNDHRDTGMAMANLAGTYSKQGRWAEAEKLELAALEAMKRSQGNDHLDTVKAMAFLAETYSNQERWAEAEKLELAVLEARKRLQGNDHRDTATAMTNLALTYSNQERWAESEELQLDALEARKRSQGNDHLDTVKAMTNLAETYSNQERWAESEELQLEALEARKRSQGNDHLDTVKAMTNLAETYSNQERWAEAEKLELVALEASKRSQGNDHRDTATAMTNLALTYSNQERWAESEELQLDALEARKRSQGNDHLDTVMAMANLAETYSNQERWAEAEKLLLAVLEARKRFPGNDHPDTVKAMANLAETYSNQEQWAEAEKLELAVLETVKRLLGNAHPDTVIAMTNLAETYLNQGRWAEAEKLQLPALEAMKTLQGNDHPDTVIAMAKLVVTYSNQKRWAEAEKLQLAELEARKTLQGSDHLDTVKAMAFLAVTYWNLEQWAKAEELELAVLEAKKSLLGIDDPETLTAMENLAATYRSQKRNKDAKLLEKEFKELRKATAGRNR